MTTLQVPPAPLVFGLKDFFKGEFICRVFPPANTNKGLSPHSCRAHHTQGVTPTALTGISRGSHCWFCLFSTPAMMLPAPTPCQLHGKLLDFHLFPLPLLGPILHSLYTCCSSQNPSAFQRGSSMLPARVPHTLQNHKL